MNVRNVTTLELT